MKVLVLGGDGMLGHQLLLSLGSRFDVKCTLRKTAAECSANPIFDPSRIYFSVDARSSGRVQEIFEDFRPEVVINCIGIVKQRHDAAESIPSLEINALLPHQLAVLCKTVNARLIHMSTDCVFSGSQGHYREDDFADARDLYGRTKYLGEVAYDRCLTLRTSIIGRELHNHQSLLDWFLAQTGTIRGFRKAIYSGFTTLEMSRIISMMIDRYPDASGLYHVSSEPIDKYSLLCLVRDKLGKDIEIVPDDEFVCDRSLDSGRFRAAFAYEPPSWDAMVEELK